MLFHRFTFWIVFGSFLYGLEAAVKTYYIEELCERTSLAIINVDLEDTGILTSLSYKSPVSCEIWLKVRNRRSLVLSIYSYNLNPQDELIIEDSDHHKIQLLDVGYFPDERKSILSDGSITIHYNSNSNTSYTHDKVKFRFVFTQTRDGPCEYDEFQCRNKRCIKKNLVCDSHNHCGDRSDQQKCGPTTDSPNRQQDIRTNATVNVLPIVLVVVGGILVIIIIVISSVLIHRAVQKKKQSQNSLPTTAAATIPEISAAPTDAQGRPSYLHQIRNSFRSMMSPKVEDVKLQQQGSESYQVPSMYPQVPSAPDLDGIDNPDFKVEE